MTTPRIRSVVSLAALTATLALGGCASASARPAWDEAALAKASPISVHFDNNARDRVHVYLVGEKREWLLGRVEPGARARLRIPVEALAGQREWMQLAVVPGERLAVQAAGDARATLTMAQPVAGLLAHQWTFSRPSAAGQLVSLRLAGAPSGIGRP